MDGWIDILFQSNTKDLFTNRQKYKRNQYKPHMQAVQLK